MKNNKICFITCVNNPRLYDETLLYLEQLEKPDNFEIEMIAVKDAKSMAEGYNRAMNKSDAKYKVYLHQDVLIVNKTFISDLLAVFTQDEKIGLIGVIGAKTLPENAIWWDADKKYGEVIENHTGTMALLKFDEPTGEHEKVVALDGLLLATQYDLPWREDVFDGFHFYDSSQSIEFVRAGYDVVVAKQAHPWVIHDCGFKPDWQAKYELYRERFINEYLTKQHKDKKNFTLLMHDFTDDYVTRDFGLVPFVMGKHYDYEVEIVCKVGADRYPTNEKYTNMTITHVTSNDELHAKMRKIDVLFLFGAYEYNLEFIEEYRRHNPHGKVYCKLDMNEIWLMNLARHQWWWTKHFFNQCDLITVECRRLQNLIKRYWDAETKYIPNGFYNFWETEVVDYKTKENVILTVGRPGDFVKNNDLVLNAFANLSENLPDWKLVMVGQPESYFEQHVTKLIEEKPELANRIELTGRLDRESVREQFKRAKIFCHTSRWEACSNVLTESFGGGCYPIFTDFNGAAGLMKYGKHGTIIPVEDLSALETALLEICCDEERLKQVSLQVQDLAQGELNWITLCGKIDTWLEE